MLLLAPRPLALPTGHSTWASARDLHDSPAALCSACATSRPRPRRRTTSARPHQRTSSTDLSRYRWRLVDRWTPFVEDQEGSRRARGRAGGLCCSGRAGASSSSPPPPLGTLPWPSLARASSSERFEDATMSLLEPPRAQNGHAHRVDGRVERCRSRRSTSSGSSRSLYVPLARSIRVKSSSMGSCTPVSRALTSLTVRAGQSRPRWHPLLFSSRKLALSLAGRLSTALVDAHRVYRESSRTQAVQKGPSLLSPLVPAATHLEPSGMGPTEAAPAVTCP